MTKQLTIKTGPYRGTWALAHSTGFGSNGLSAQYRRVGKSGRLLVETLNLTAEQVAQVEAA